ncbi:MAG: SCO family protein [Anaerolineales bacterium]
MSRRLTWFLGGLVILLGLWTGWLWFRPPALHGTVIQSPETAPDFTLQAADGRMVSLRDFRGKYVLLYFGYTFCPDVCPASLGNLAVALRRLGEKANQVQVIMISVDPERDTPEKMAEYVSHFHPSFIGLSGDAQEIARVAALYGIFYEKQEVESSAEYLVNHTATIMVIDREGRLKLIWPFGVTPDEIVADLKYLLRR